MLKNYLNFLLLSMTLFFTTNLQSQIEEANKDTEIKKEIPYDNSYFQDSQSEYYLKEEPINNHLKEGDNFQAKFLNMLFILTLLIGFMILASWLLKRMMKARITQINQASYIKILETRQLSPKSVLYFIEIENKKVLIGESQTGLHFISNFDAVDNTASDPN